MSFKDRFKDRNEVVQRDGSNAFTGPSHQQQPARRNPPASHAPSATPSHHQQPPQQYHSQVPSIAPSYAPSVYSAHHPAPQQQQPSFFMTGGGYPVAYNPYGYENASVSPGHQQLPPLSQNDNGAEDDHGQQQQRSTFAKQVAANSSFLGSGMESPTSAGRRQRVKPALPDFRELEIVQHGRRQGQRVERMPVLVDHPNTGEYHQYTLSEYRRMQQEYSQRRWGGLGADDNEEKQAAREKNQKIFEYGKQVNAVNFAVLDQLYGDDWHNRPIEKVLGHDAQLALIKRQRAKQYADAVKPPVVSARKRPIAKTPQPTKSGATVDVDKELETLGEKHRRDEEAIRRIKAQLNMLPAS